MAKQSVCAQKVKADMEATARDSSDVLKTVKSYTFEYSPKHDSCVIIMQYKTQDKTHGKMIQILAINAFTMQPMEAHRNIFLEKPDDVTAIERATNFLLRDIRASAERS